LTSVVVGSAVGFVVRFVVGLGVMSHLVPRGSPPWLRFGNYFVRLGVQSAQLPGRLWELERLALFTLFV
jgi:hypothetical protein